jgi:hypothetical protein
MVVMSVSDNDRVDPTCKRIGNAWRCQALVFITARARACINQYARPTRRY